MTVALVRAALGGGEAGTQGIAGLFTDGEISTILALQPVVTYAAAALADMAAARFATKVNASIGPTRVEASRRMEQCHKIAEWLREGGGGDFAGAGLAGGIEMGGDNNDPTFSIGQDDIDACTYVDEDD